MFIIQLWRLRFNWSFQVEFCFTRNSNVPNHSKLRWSFLAHCYFRWITCNNSESFKIGIYILIFNLPNGESTLQCTNKPKVTKNNPFSTAPQNLYTVPKNFPIMAFIPQFIHFKLHRRLDKTLLQCECSEMLRLIYDNCYFSSSL